MPIFSRAFLLLLIISLGMGQKANTSPQSDKNLVRVGYVGESLQNIPDAYGKMIRQKMLALLNQNYYEFHHPNDLYQSHPSQIDSNLSQHIFRSITKEIPIHPKINANPLLDRFPSIQNKLVC